MTIHEACAGYWRECFACPEYLPDRVFFCRRANLARFGSAEVETEDADDGGGTWKSGRERRELLKDGATRLENGRQDGTKTRKSESSGGAWWNGRRFRTRRR